MNDQQISDAKNDGMPEFRLPYKLIDQVFREELDLFFLLLDETEHSWRQDKRAWQVAWTVYFYRDALTEDSVRLLGQHLDRIQDSEEARNSYWWRLPMIFAADILLHGVRLPDEKGCDPSYSTFSKDILLEYIDHPNSHLRLRMIQAFAFVAELIWLGEPGLIARILHNLRNIHAYADWSLYCALKTRYPVSEKLVFLAELEKEFQNDLYLTEIIGDIRELGQVQDGFLCDKLAEAAHYFSLRLLNQVCNLEKISQITKDGPPPAQLVLPEVAPPAPSKAGQAFNQLKKHPFASSTICFKELQKEESQFPWDFYGNGL